MHPCLVCESPTEKKLGLCPACCRSYDKMNREDSTTYGLIKWAARRARVALHKKLKTQGSRALPP